MTAASLLLLLSTAAQDGSVDWKGRGSESFVPYLDQAKKEEKPIFLYFASEDDAASRALNEGPLRDGRVVEASAGFVCIYVERSGGKKNSDLAKNLKVDGWPTLILCDASGKTLGTIATLDTDGILKGLRAVAGNAAAKGPDRPAFTDNLSQGVKDSRGARKPMGIYFYDDSPASLSVDAAFLDPAVKPLLDRIVFTQHRYGKTEELSTHFDVAHAPAIVVVDVSRTEEKLLLKVAGSRSARELRRDLEEALAAHDPSAAAPAPDPGTILPPAPREKLSDDEIDRKFIQARIAVALDLAKRNLNAKAIDVLEDVVKTFPKHVGTLEAKKLLEELRKK